MANEDDDNDQGGLPEGLPEVLSTLFGQAQQNATARRAHLEEFNLQIEKVAQQFRTQVYHTTDQLNGPSEAAAVNALRSWEKTCINIRKGLRKVSLPHRAAWIEAVIAGMKVIAVMDQCPCDECVAKRKATS